MKPYLEEAHRRIWAEEVGTNRLFLETEEYTNPRF
jgi:hypothetical protein